MTTRRALATSLSVVVLLLAASCGGDDDSNASTTTTTALGIEEFDPDADEERFAVDESSSTSSTSSTIPDEYDPEEFCQRSEEVLAVFDEGGVLTEEVVDLMTTLPETLPPGLEDDLDVFIDYLNERVGDTAEELAGLEADLAAEPGVAESFMNLGLFRSELC